MRHGWTAFSTLREGLKKGGRVGNILSFLISSENYYMLENHKRMVSMSRGRGC